MEEYPPAAYGGRADTQRVGNDAGNSEAMGLFVSLRRSRHGLSSAGLLTAAALCATAAPAQKYPDSGSSDPYDQPREAPDQASLASQPGQNAAATQVQIEPERRYQPDEIRAGDEQRDEEGPQRRAGNAASRLNSPVARNRPTIVPAPLPNEFEKYASQIADKPLRRFGANLLVPEARDFTAPPTTTVPADYHINPGDQLVVGLTGAVQADSLKLVVDQDGRIFLPRVGAIAVGGVRYADLQQVIAAQVARQYRDFHVSVSVGRLHGITVYVTGFAAQPGSYTVNSLSTLVNAVLAAGGPSPGGSFRSIQLRRGGRLVSDFDLYDLLLKGDKSGDAVLQNGDVIFIAPAGAQVAVIGSVNQEAIFEARAGDTLTDILRYSGGFSSVADSTRLLLLDSLNLQTGWRQLNPADLANKPAERAQVLRVVSNLGIARPIGDQPILVTLSGEVNRPGRYYVPAGTPLSAVVAQAGGLTGAAYPYGTVFTRESLRLQQRESYARAVSDLEYRLSAAPLSSALARPGDIERLSSLRAVVEKLRERRPDGRLVLTIGPDTPALPDSLVLENNDAVYVPPRPVSVGVFGSVSGPASFTWRSGMTIGDYIREAGGVQKIGDKGQTFVVRANGTLLAPRHGTFSGSIFAERALPGDLVYVPINPSRGETWAKIRDLSSVLFSGALATASVVAVSK